MGNYNLISPRPPHDIDQRHAYLIGGGIASLAAAAFLVRDARMPGENILVLESLERPGGSLDGAGSPQQGYVVRGGREIEAHFECFMDLFRSIPSLADPDRSVLDDFHELNLAEPIESHCRLTENQGQIADFSQLGLSSAQAMTLARLHLTTEEALGATTAEEFFPADFFETNFWYFWASMFAFQPWHSVVEFKRYMERFMHLISGMNQLKGILHTEYNQYDSLVLPLVRWLQTKGVQVMLGATVTDIEVDTDDDQITATAVHYRADGQEHTITPEPTDLVLFTNGSMTQNSTYGDLDHPAVIDRSDDKGCFSVWQKMAPQSPFFGHPDVFCEDIDRTKWLSFTVTLADDDLLFPYLEKLTDNPSGMGGVTAVKDSAWMLSWGLPKNPHFADQPDNVKVLWAYALNMDTPGDYVQKSISECTGREMFTELLYHVGMKDRIDEVLEHTVNVIPAMLPYITSQFMPRVPGDRPQVIPQGSRNLAFLGQFAEVPDDCVFTVEYSIRTAMTAVYGLLGISRPVIPVHPSRYDIRVLAEAAQVLLGLDKIPVKDLPLSALLARTELTRLLG
ncbi:oleate hydratase [Austwickia chelonae]|uniref:Oleate hydratase n=1 Tax=Austwickia chelonae NBRC 105200 TaxID=1184607 RepID=K6VS45_9MICO|nr:oleate hydratase [Austwickia chelonae]GAB78160.1 hypothetical protein AUCHE_08_04050 [Austwickia chelonae NBRC 105200]SEV97906.1 oleate hydratase [Austwickia chelonae]